jgi:hypothetical protein
MKNFFAAKFGGSCKCDSEPDASPSNTGGDQSIATDDANASKNTTDSTDSTDSTDITDTTETTDTTDTTLANTVHASNATLTTIAELNRGIAPPAVTVTANSTNATAILHAADLPACAKSCGREPTSCLEFKLQCNECAASCDAELKDYYSSWFGESCKCPTLALFSDVGMHEPPACATTCGGMPSTCDDYQAMCNGCASSCSSDVKDFFAKKLGADCVCEPITDASEGSTKQELSAATKQQQQQQQQANSTEVVAANATEVVAANATKA